MLKCDMHQELRELLYLLEVSVINYLITVHGLII